jgi:hypothetical protein
MQVEREFKDLGAALLQDKRARRILLPAEEEFDAPAAVKPTPKPDAKLPK